jgi:hypothetical protein
MPGSDRRRSQDALALIAHPARSEARLSRTGRIGELSPNAGDRRRRWLMRTHLLSSAPVIDPPSAASVTSRHSLAVTRATRLWQQFTRDCQVPPGARLELRSSGSAISITLPLNAPWLIAGTDATCGLRLHGPDVDPAHYVWFWLAGQLYGLDLSLNGSAPAVPYEGWWRDGSAVRIGTHQLVFRAGTAVPVPFKLDGPIPDILVTAGTDRRSLRLDRWLTLIGRDRRCEIVLDDPGVADRQAALIRTPRSLWLVNLAEASPPMSGGQPRAWLPLDEFTIGRTTFSIETVWPAAPQTSVPAPGPAVVPTVSDTRTADSADVDRARLTVLHAALGQLLEHHGPVNPAASAAVLAAVQQLVSRQSAR